MDTTNRSTSSHIRKAEAMNKWPDSETGKASDKHPLTRIKIKFDYGVMLLDAVGKSDIEETLRLLELGADVNYANADGLTSLHKACVDENFPFVKALVDNGANIEACDIEGWTPLHAAACGSSLEIIKFLVNKGANIVAVNSEGQLPIDLTNDDQIENYLENEIVQKDIDLDEARESEEKIMMSDATKWMNEGKLVDLRDSQGATPLHVAASKGYLDVIKLISVI
uniref:Protein phosphatase 1 regulatory subunit 12A (Trinotate prediction) n=1 Tax=Henneguya salminicola TaxID=69463 RepID=A0A6G3MGL0_HENSL